MSTYEDDDPDFGEGSSDIGGDDDPDAGGIGDEVGPFDDDDIEQ
jgi:hypothetical protein